MSREDEVWQPGDRELIDGALAEARQAGVPEDEIQGILREAAEGPQDGFTVPVLGGKLGYATRMRRVAPAPPVPSVFEQATTPHDDAW